MIAKRLALALLLIAAAANAQPTRRGSTPQPGQPPGDVYTLINPATVVGSVSAVSGNIISVANGTVTIDASTARVVDANGAAVALSSISTGSLIVATLKSDNVAANAPLPATFIAVSKPAALTLTGAVQAVDAAHNNFTLLGRTIQVTAQTSFGGPFIGTNVKSLADIQTNELVAVQANPGGTQTIVAVAVLLLSPHIDHPQVLHGTVKSIAADAWVIAINGKDTTVSVNAQTQIAGSPKVGDSVVVTALTDSSGKLVALSIIKSLLPIFQPPF
jgi:exosome complex RNA-binding protein Csl4